jgi:hypothetical protein
MKGYCRIFLSKSAKAAEMVIAYVFDCLNFESADHLPVFFDQEINLRPMVSERLRGYFCLFDADPKEKTTVTLADCRFY